MMMPPKKSKAARSEEPSQNGTSAAPVSTDSDVSDVEDSQPQAKVNIFATEIVEGKRERHIPVPEQKLYDWWVLLLRLYLYYYGHLIFGGGGLWFVSF